MTIHHALHSAGELHSCASVVGRACSHNGQVGFSAMQQLNSPCELVYLLLPWCRAELPAMGHLCLWLTGVPRNGTAPCVCSLPSSKAAGEDFSAHTEPKLVQQHCCLLCTAAHSRGAVWLPAFCRDLCLISRFAFKTRITL